jgi:hypothetical protein
MNETELDRQLRLALQEECDAESVSRLELFWRRQRRAESRRLTLRRCAAIAASLAALTGVVALLTWEESRPAPSLTGRESTPQAPRLRQESLPEAPENNSLTVGREPTAYETLMFTAQIRQEEAAKTSQLTKVLNAAIDQLSVDPALAVDQLAEASLLKSSDAEAAVLQRLPRANEAQARGMTRLLARYGTNRSMPALLAIAREPSLRAQAIDAIVSIAGEDGLAAAARQSNSPIVRRALFERLLGINSESSLRRYLALVSDPSIRADVLAAADALESPPTGQLLAMLKDDDQATRLSAAIVLGRMNGPQVTAGLIAIVMEDPAAPSEAWLALLACRDESAARFLADAALHPRLLGHVNNARMTWARMIQ